MLKITCNFCKKWIEITNCKILQNSIDWLKPYTVLTTSLALSDVTKGTDVSLINADNTSNKAQFYDYANIFCRQCKKKIAIYILNSANFIFHCFKESILTYVYLLTTQHITISYFNDTISPLKCSSTAKIARSFSEGFKCNYTDEIGKIIQRTKHIQKGLEMINKMNISSIHIKPAKRKYIENISKK